MARRLEQSAPTRQFMVVLAAAALMTGGCTSMWENAEPLEVVQDVDIERFTGKWFEIAKYPVFFEQGCYDVTADYGLRDDGSVSVLNSCFAADGSLANTIEGSATIADPQVSAKLTVSFFPPFGAPYWIIDLGEDYEYAVVGDPTRTFLWILSRTPEIDPDTYDQILASLPDKGYDPARLELTPRSGENAQ